MKRRMMGVGMLLMALVLGSIAWGVEMPQVIKNGKDLKVALKAAKTPQDHERIATYYKAEAERLDAEAAGYEQAAAKYRSGAYVKNIMSPTTPGRYEYTAKEDREQAQSNRQLAAAQEQLAKNSMQASN